MAWFEPTDFTGRLSQTELNQLSTGQGRPTAADDTVLQACLDRAEQEVRGLLSGIATLPATLPMGLLRDCALDLAVEVLFLRQPGEAAKLPDGWKDRVKRSRDLLMSMVEGRIPVPVVPAVTRSFAAIAPATPADGAFNIDATGQVWP